VRPAVASTFIFAFFQQGDAETTPMLKRVIQNSLAALYRSVAVRAGVTTGKRFHVGPGSIISAPRQLTIGDDVYIGKYCTIQCDGQIGNWVLIANNVGVIGRYDHDHRKVGVPIRLAPHIEDAGRKQLPGDIVEIQDDVWIGYGAIVLSGITIGRGSIIAAGSVVIKTVPPYSIMRGNPAEVVGRRFRTEADIAAHEEAIYGRQLVEGALLDPVAGA
jgi:acetyltransferase-like isoleucine patch superfamily enzyme